MSKNNLEIITKEVSPIVLKATSLKITDTITLSQSAEFLSQCNKYLDGITSEKKKITDPINAALKEVRLRYKPVEDNLNEAITSLRTEQSRYATAERAKQLADETKIAARVAKGTLKIETAVNKLSVMDKPENQVTTDNGMVKFRDKQTLKITDITKIPRQFLIPNESAILESLKAGNKVGGCEIEILSIPVNYR